MIKAVVNNSIKEFTSKGMQEIIKPSFMLNRLMIGFSARQTAC